MDLLTDKNVRLLVGLLASITMLVLIIADALIQMYTLDSSTIYLLTLLIWAFLGIDLIQGPGRGGPGRGRNRGGGEGGDDD